MKICKESEMKDKFNILAISDTHLNPFEVKKDWVGNIDAVIHCGDLTNCGSYEEFVQGIDLLVIQLKELGCRLCLLTGGNHDNILQSEHGLAKCLAYLELINENHQLKFNICIDELIELKGLKIFISPYYRRIGSGDVFGFHYTEQMTHELFDNLIPSKVDVLVTHGPGLNILDYSEADMYNPRENYGCEILANFLTKRTDITIHIHGHIHQCGGKYQEARGRTTFNVATKAMLIDFTSLNNN